MLIFSHSHVCKDGYLSHTLLCTDLPSSFFRSATSEQFIYRALPRRSCFTRSPQDLVDSLKVMV